MTLQISWVFALAYMKHVVHPNWDIIVWISLMIDVCTIDIAYL